MKKASTIKTPLAVIGTTEFVVLPQNSDALVPAKVDTGADGSAVWATEITEQDGELSFVLFAPNSAFYTGKVLTTSKYRVIKVKNSFGVDEYRYRVWLSLMINGKPYRASFTLANRENNRFPILIGKRFLNKKFLVDVSRSNIVTDIPEQPRVVVLSSSADQGTKDLFDNVATLSETPLSLTRYRLLDYSIDEQGEPRILLPDGIDIASARYVYFKTHAHYPEHAAAIASYLQYRHVAFGDQELESSVSRSKISEMFQLASAGVQVPAATLVDNKYSDVSYSDLVAKLGTQFVLKDPFSDRGLKNYMVANAEEYAEAMQRLGDVPTIVAQQYIPNDGFYRLLIMGADAVQVVYRKAVPHDDPLRRHLNKPGGSPNARELQVEECDPEMIVIACRAALAMRRTIAGVDMIQDKVTKKWYVIEANNNPQMRSGFNQEQKQQALAAFLKKKGQQS